MERITFILFVSSVLSFLELVCGITVGHTREKITDSVSVEKVVRDGNLEAKQIHQPTLKGRLLKNN